MFGNHQQDNWVSVLPLAEFAYNNGLQTTAGKSPFEICQGYNPHLSIGHEPGNVPLANDHASFLKEGYQEVQAALGISQERMKEFYDWKHREVPEIQAGNQVWLNHRNIKSDRPSPKLSHKKLGPYLVLEKFGTHAFKLELPQSMKIHPVFHITLLTKFKTNPHGHEPEHPPPITTEEGEEEYKVEEVLDSKRIGRKRVKCFVKWKGYGVGEQTWEPQENLESSKEAVERFHKRYPRKPKPMP